MPVEGHADTPVTISLIMKNVNLKKKIFTIDKIKCIKLLLLLMIIFSDTFFFLQRSAVVVVITEHVSSVCLLLLKH